MHLLNAETGTIYTDAISAGNLNLSMISDNYSMSGNISGAGTLSIAPYTASKTIGIATGATCGSSCNILFNNTFLGYIQSGFSNVTIGSTADTGAMDVRAYSWTNPLSLVTGSGPITINGAQAMGSNNFTLQSDTTATFSSTVTTTGNALPDQASQRLHHHWRRQGRWYIASSDQRDYGRLNHHRFDFRHRCYNGWSGNFGGEHYHSIQHRQH